MDFEKIINKNKNRIIILSLIFIILYIISFWGMIVIGNIPSEEQIEKSNYYIIDFHEALFGYNLIYKIESDRDSTILNKVEDIYWNESNVLIKCWHYPNIYNYYKISLDSCDMNLTHISPASFYNILDWQKSNGNKMEHRHFES